MQEHPIFSPAQALAWVAAKAVVLYLVAVFAFRVGHRRTLAEMSAFDFGAAVAVGAIVGRVPNSTTSALAGVVTLVTILLAHAAISHLRHSPAIARLFDHAPLVLVRGGKVFESRLRQSGVTRSDLYGLLRQHGLCNLNQVKYVVFEQKGKISVIAEKEFSNTGIDLIREVEAKANILQ